jgi:hypothetical protein
LEIPTSLPEKRGRKRNIHLPTLFCLQKIVLIQLKEIVDVLVADLSRRSEILQETLLNFEFLSGLAFISMKSTELERATYNLAVKYNKDLDASEFRLRD